MAPSPALAQQSSAILCQGRWILGQQGEAIRPPIPGGRMMGLQTSGLTYDGQLLWSVGDQRSNYPAGVLRIDPQMARLKGHPMRLEVTRETEGEVPVRLPEANPDLEGIAIQPGATSRVYIAVESDGTYVLECAFDRRTSSLSILRVFSARFTTPPNQPDSNRRFEGIAVRGDRVYLAYEKKSDGYPQIYQGNIPPRGANLDLRGLDIPFSRLPRRSGKGGVNVNGMALIGGSAPALAMVARDQERVLFYELDIRRLSYVDVDFRDPEGEEIYWTSPEGIAVDPNGDRLWMVNDPDSVRGNYRRKGDAVARGNYQAMVPLLFELRLSEVLAARVRVD